MGDGSIGERPELPEFLTTDGEKPDRDRDSEFVADGGELERINGAWREGWELLERTLSGLDAADLKRNVPREIDSPMRWGRAVSGRFPLPNAVPEKP